MDAFACHFLTDMFSASHTRTPRSSIEAYWDKKVPGFDELLVKWLADEVALAVNRSPSGFLEWLGVTVGAPLGARALGGAQEGPQGRAAAQLRRRRRARRP